MDMRTFGKDFELYYNRAKDEHGVRFIRSRIHSIDPLPDGDLQIRFADESGEEKTEAFNMIVLSVGMEVSQAARELAADPGGGYQRPRFCGHLALCARGGKPSGHLCLRGHAGSQRHSRIGHAGVGRGRGGERLAGGRPLDRDQDPAGAHTQRHQGRKIPPASGCSSATAASTSAASSTCRSCRNTPRPCPTWPTWKTTCSPAPRTPRSR